MTNCRVRFRVFDDDREGGHIVDSCYPIAYDQSNGVLTIRLAEPLLATDARGYRVHLDVFDFVERTWIRYQCSFARIVAEHQDSNTFTYVWEGDWVETGVKT